MSILLFATTCYAQNIHRTDIIALGMGNAYIANGRDFNAFLYNPALLSKIDRNWYVEFGNATFSLSSNFFSKKDFLENNQAGFVNFQANALSPDPTLQLRSTQIQDRVKDEILDEPTELSFSPSLIAKLWHFGLAVYTDWSYGFVMDFAGIIDSQNQRFEPPSARTRGEQDIAIILGYGSKIKFVKGLAIGGNAKVFWRRLAQRRLSPNDFGDVVDISRVALGEANFFTRFGFDLGITYDFGNRYSLGLVFNDIIDSNNFADVEPLSINLGFSFEATKELIFDFDIIDLLDKTDNELIEKNLSFEETDRFRMGVQYAKLEFLGFKFPLRYGLGGGFITAGFGIVSPAFYKFDARLDYALANSTRIDELAHFLQLKLRILL